MYYALWLFSYSFILFYVIHANCVLCVVPWVGGVDVFTMCVVHRLSALISWERLSVSIMLYVCTTTDSHIRAVICRCTVVVMLNVNQRQPIIIDYILSTAIFFFFFFFF